MLRVDEVHESGEPCAVPIYLTGPYFDGQYRVKRLSQIAPFQGARKDNRLFRGPQSFQTGEPARRKQKKKKQRCPGNRRGYKKKNGQRR